MPSKPKCNYDIQKIAALENEAQEQGKRISIREIARRNNWDEDNTQQWIHRNWIKVTRYIERGFSDGRKSDVL